MTTLMAHLATFAGIDARETIPLLEFMLVAGIIALYAAFYKLVQTQWPEKTPAETVLDLIPAWAKVVVGATFAYSFFAFAIRWFAAEGTGASIDGIYYLISIDKSTKRQISYEEYRILSTYAFRVYSGGLLPFYVCLTTGYAFCLR